MMWSWLKKLIRTTTKTDNHEKDLTFPKTKGNITIAKIKELSKFQDLEVDPIGVGFQYRYKYRGKWSE
jgi:hypothetical protein